MKLLLKILVLLVVGQTAYGQIYTKPNNSYGLIWNRGRFDSTVFLPTQCGTPSTIADLRSTNQNMMALLYDSCGHKLYLFDPSLKEWLIVGGGSDSVWKLIGNAGTDASSFLGTTDEKPLWIATNGTRRIMVDSVTGKTAFIDGPDTLYLIPGSENLIAASTGSDLSLKTDNAILRIGGLKKFVIGGIDDGGRPTTDSFLVYNPTDSSVKKMSTALFAQQAALDDTADALRSAIASGDYLSGTGIDIDSKVISADSVPYNSMLDRVTRSVVQDTIATFYRNDQGSVVRIGDTLLIAFTRYTLPNTSDLSAAEIYIKRSGDNGNTWTTGATAINNPGTTVQAPSLHRQADGDLVMIYRRMWTTDSSHILKVVSADNGYTWSEPVKINPNNKYTTPASDVIYKDSSGRLWFGYNEVLNGCYSSACASSVGKIMISDDDGDTWVTLSATIRAPDSLVTEQGFYELQSSKDIIMYWRGRSGYVYASRCINSDTAAANWTPSFPLGGLRAPNSQTTIKMTPDGSYMAFHNRLVGFNITGIPGRRVLTTSSSMNGLDFREVFKTENTTNAHYIEPFVFFDKNIVYLWYSLGNDTETRFLLMQDKISMNALNYIDVPNKPINQVRVFPGDVEMAIFQPAHKLGNYFKIRSNIAGSNNDTTNVRPTVESLASTGSRTGFQIWSKFDDQGSINPMDAGVNIHVTNPSGAPITTTSARLLNVDNGSTSLFNVMADGKVSMGGNIPVRTLHPETQDATTNTVIFPLQISHTTSGTAVAGSGVGIEFANENGSGTRRVSGTIDNRYSDVTNAAEHSDWYFRNIRNGSITTTGMITASGDWNINNTTNRTYGLYVNRSVAFEKDSITRTSNLASIFGIGIDTATANRNKLFRYRFSDLPFASSASGMPTGGMPGYALRKVTGSDYDVEWAATDPSIVVQDSTGEYTATITTTDATPTTIVTIPIASGTNYMIQAVVLGIKSDGSASYGATKYRRFHKDGVGGLFAATLHDIIADEYSGGFTTATSTITNSGGTNMIITVTGEASTTITWKVKYKIIFVSTSI